MLPRLLASFVLVALATSAYAASNVLTWSDNSANETSFNIERAAGVGTPLIPSGPFTALATVGVNVTTYTDATVLEGASYCYRVNASNAGGPSAFSNVACRAVPVTPPNAPSNLIITWLGAGGGSIKTSPVVATCATPFGTLHIDCEIPSFPLGMLVTIQETPDSKSKFTGWGEACRGMSGQCTVAMAGDVLVSVAFAPR